MINKKPFPYNGVLYESRAAAAMAMGIDPALMSYYVHKHGLKTGEEILAYRARKPKNLLRPYMISTKEQERRVAMKLEKKLRNAQWDLEIKEFKQRFSKGFRQNN